MMRDPSFIMGFLGCAGADLPSSFAVAIHDHAARRIADPKHFPAVTVASARATAISQSDQVSHLILPVGRSRPSPGFAGRRGADGALSPTTTVRFPKGRSTTGAA